jgi:RNA-binding protein 39
MVSNMFNPEEWVNWRKLDIADGNSETERNWDLDLAEDVKGEVETKYGKLKRIKVDKMSAVSVGSKPLTYSASQNTGWSRL